MSAWEEAYRRVGLLWGLKPDPMLIEYAGLVPKGNVFDLGIGEGRNALFFAKMGYEVEGVDLSQTAVERCIRRAEKANLKVEAEVGDLRDVGIPEGRYSLIITAWVLNFFKRKEAEEIISKMKNGLKNDGLVYFAVFSVDDPGHEKAKKNLQVVGQNTFYSKKRDYYIHYYTKDEVLSLFPDLKIIYCAQGTALDLQHGKPHHHGFIVYIGQNSAV